jgi:hypothetical protein
LVLANICEGMPRDVHGYVFIDLSSMCYGF